MTDPLVSAWAKLDRGKEHADAFKSQLTEATDSEKHPVILHRQLETQPAVGRSALLVTRVTFVIAELPTFTTQHAIMLGDALHGFRSALDHLAWVLVRRTGRRLNARAARRVAFPLARSRSSFWARSKSTLLPGVAVDPFLTLAERYQPYHRSGVGRIMRDLRNLSDTDKHRFVIPAVILMGSTSHTVEIKRGIPLSPIEFMDFAATRPSGGRRFQPLKVGTELVEVFVATNDGQPDVRMEFGMRVAPILRGTWNHASLELDFISAMCTEILSEFEALL